MSKTCLYATFAFVSALSFMPNWIEYKGTNYGPLISYNHRGQFSLGHNFMTFFAYILSDLYKEINAEGLLKFLSLLVGHFAIFVINVPGASVEPMLLFASWILLMAMFHVYIMNVKNEVELYPDSDFESENESERDIRDQSDSGSGSESENEFDHNVRRLENIRRRNTCKSDHKSEYEDEIEIGRPKLDRSENNDQKNHTKNDNSSVLEDGPAFEDYHP